MKSVIVSAIVVVMLSVVSPVFCQYDTGDENARVFDGKVSAVSADRSTVTVTGGSVIEFPVSSATKVTDACGAVTPTDIRLTDLGVGDYVNVSYRLDPDKDSSSPYTVLRVARAYCATAEKAKPLVPITGE